MTRSKPGSLSQQGLHFHTVLVIGGRDMDAGAVSVRLHGKGPRGAKPKAEVVADILAAIKSERREFRKANLATEDCLKKFWPRFCISGRC